MRSILFTFIFLIGFEVQATSLVLETEAGSGYGAAHVGIEWSKKDDLQGFYFGNASAFAGGSQSKIEDTTTGNVTTIKTQDADLGIGFGYNQILELQLSGYTSRTPETKYQQSGSKFELSFRHQFSGSSELSLEEIEEKFQPSFAVGVGSGSSRIRQTVSFTILNTPIERDIDLDQKEISGFVTAQFVEWLRLRISGSTYSYSKSKSDLQTAFNNRFLNYYTTDLVSTIAGLPESSVSLQGIFLLNSDWDLEVRGTSTKMIVDDSIARRGRVLATRYWKDWSFAGGLSRSETTQLKEFTGLFNITYGF